MNGRGHRPLLILIGNEASTEAAYLVLLVIIISYSHGTICMHDTNHKQGLLCSW